jgi:hypothetical protein
MNFKEPASFVFSKISKIEFEILLNSGDVLPGIENQLFDNIMKLLQLLKYVQMACILNLIGNDLEEAHGYEEALEWLSLNPVHGSLRSLFLF